MMQQAEELERQYKEQFGVNPPKISGQRDISRKEVTVKTPKQSSELRKQSMDVKPRSNSKEL